MIERRFPRVSIRVPLFVTIGAGRIYEKAVEIECRDISGGGLSFETTRDIPLDSKSKIVVGGMGSLPSSAIIEGRVVYRLKEDEHFTVGVEFLDFVGTTREEVIAHIESWQDKASSS